MKTYSTSDIVLAATLRCKGYSLERITIAKLPSGAQRGVFHFNDVDEQVLIEFDQQKILVEPIAYNTNVRSLNAAIKRLQVING